MFNIYNSFEAPQQNRLFGLMYTHYQAPVLEDEE